MEQVLGRWRRYPGIHGQTNKRVLGCGLMLRLSIAGNSVFTDKDISSIEKLGYKVATVQREDSPEIPNPETTIRL